MSRERVSSSSGARAPASDDLLVAWPAAGPLRARSRAAGLVLALSFLVPCATWHDGSRFLWELAPDLRLASLWALLSPAVCGAIVVVGTSACRRAPSLALVVLASIAGLLLVAPAGAEALAWDMLPQPEIWDHGSPAGLVAVAFVAAGVCLYPERAGRRAALAVLAAAVPFAAAHLLVPAGGEAPVLLVGRVVAHVASHGPRGNLLSACMLSLIVLWPGVAVAAGWLHARRPALRPRHPVAVLAVYGLPAVLLPIVRRSMVNPWGGSGGAAAALGGIVVLGAALVLLTGATSFLAAWVASPEAEPEQQARRPERRTAIVSLAVVALATLGTSALSRRSDTGTDWQPGPSTPEGDHLFGTLLPAWNDARKSEDVGEPRIAGPGASGVALANASLVSSARALDADLGVALAALVSEAAGADLMELRWYRLVERVNEASRRAGLPYYVDPTEVVGAAGDPPRRWYRIDTYRIEKVSRFAHAGEGFATLHVRAMAPARTRRVGMGLSRDLQPFAVVVLDEIEAYQQELEQLAARAPPRCGEGHVDSEAAEAALLACGELLVGLRREGELGAALLGATERHELQHQIDGAYMARSGWLEGRLAWHAPALRARIQRELSAYLAQMTAPGAAPRLTLLRLLRMALLVRRGAEHQVALLAFEALGDGERVEPQADPVSRAYLRLRGLDDPALRARAASAWRQVYGGERTDVTRTEPGGS